jgi:nitroreductase
LWSGRLFAGFSKTRAHPLNNPLNDTSRLAVAGELMLQRRSVRAFLPTPVDIDLIRSILDMARHCPSGTNMQPWTVYVATGATQHDLVQRLGAAFDDPDAASLYKEEYPYYPGAWFSPFAERRRTLGLELYTRLSIGKSDRTRMLAQHRRNVECFGAPASVFFTIDRRLTQGSWLDYGMFIQNVALAVSAHGLASCVQAAFNPFHEVIRGVVGWPDGEMLVCGMSLGHADAGALENGLVVEREPVDAFARFFS